MAATTTRAFPARHRAIDARDAGGRGATSRKLVLAGALVALVLVATGIAVAFWTTASSAGAGSATTGVGEPLTLTPGTPSDAVYPGAQAAVALTATNPSSVTSHIEALVLDTSQGTSGFGVDAAHSGCSLSALSFASQSNSGAGWSIPGGESLVITLSGALSMTTNADNACQGAVFSVYLKAASA